MKRKILFFILTMMMLSSITCFSQISTTLVKQLDKKIVTKKYDSLLNHPRFDDLELLIGQVLYVKPIEEGYYRNSGYSGFYSDEKLKKGYKKLKGSVLDYSKYESLNGKYFNVLSVKKKSGKLFVFKLEEAEKGEIIYWKCENFLIEKRDERLAYFAFSFPFVTVGFYEKLKKRCVGKSYVIGNVSFRFWGDNINLNTGGKVKHPYGENQEWKCVDVTISEPDYELCLVLENEKNEKLVVNYNRIVVSTISHYGKGQYPEIRVFTKEESNSYELKFGKEQWDDILQGTIWIGMTSEMCKVSIGKPDEVNGSKTENSNFEQWVYEERLIYFLDGKLSSWLD